MASKFSDPSTEATELDLRGLKCPLPVLRTRKALQKAKPGSVLVVYCTDPMTAIDVPVLVRQTGNVLEQHIEQKGYRIFSIRKSM